MIDFYTGSSPNGVKILYALEEMGLPYKTIIVDIFGGAQFKSDFTKINPLAKIPAIVDHDGLGGKPITIFESGAILLYLAEKTGKFLSKDPAARYAALQWMMVQMTGIGPMGGQFVHYLRFAPKDIDNEYSLSRYRTQYRRFLDNMEQRLGEAPFLGGADLSIADFAMWPWARLISPMLGKEHVADYPKLADYVARIAARPAAVRAVAANDAIRAQMTTFEAASADQRDKVFGRGAYAQV